jgi:hypothetical protein
MPLVKPLTMATPTNPPDKSDDDEADNDREMDAYEAGTFCAVLLYDENAGMNEGLFQVDDRSFPRPGAIRHT